LSFRTLIKSALIVDGTGSPAYKSDILLDGDKIAAIGKLKSSTEVVIDGRGLVLAPGFIDVHSHSELNVLVDPSAPSKIFQGITTEITGNCGTSAVPDGEQLLEERRAYFKNYGKSFDCRGISDYIKMITGLKLLLQRI